jgi:hypothetical protein
LFWRYVMKVSFDFDLTLMLPSGNPNEEFVSKFKDHMRAGDDLVIVTSRDETTESKIEIKDFLDDHGIRVQGIYFTNHDDKGPTLKDLGIYLHYDDDFHELMVANDHGIKTVNAFNAQAEEDFNEYYGVEPMDEKQTFKTFFNESKE